MSDKLLKLVKRLRDAALDLYHEPVRSHVPVDRSDLKEIVEDWSRLVSENLAERLEVARLKAENEALRNADEWIKCSEKLPDLDEDVLAVDQYGDIDVGHYFSGYMGKLCFSSNKEISMPTHWKKFIGLPERTGT